MIEIGKYQTLTILRETSVGLYLGDEEGEDVLLPNKYCPKNFEIGDPLKVFVYRDYAERKVATDLIPKIHMHEFAFLRVTAVSSVGAFMDWGLEKGLIVPFREQRQKMEEGRWYMVFMDLDVETDRLYASNKIDNFLDNEELSVQEGEEVKILVSKKTDLGYNVIINHKHKGLIFENEVFRDLNIGEDLTGYVKKIREDNKIDISLQAIGFHNFNDVNAEQIYATLQKNNGFLALNDKSNPEEIYEQLEMSKKAFKKAIGSLYKDKKIILKENGIEILESPSQ